MDSMKNEAPSKNRFQSVAGALFSVSLCGSKTSNAIKGAFKVCNEILSLILTFSLNEKGEATIVFSADLYNLLACSIFEALSASGTRTRTIMKILASSFTAKLNTESRSFVRSIKNAPRKGPMD